MKFVDNISSYSLSFLKNHDLTLGHHRASAAQIHHLTGLNLRSIKDILVEFLIFRGQYLLKSFDKRVSEISLFAVKQIYGGQLAFSYLLLKSFECEGGCSHQ